MIESDISYMERYTRAVRIIIGYPDLPPTATVAEDPVMFAAGPQLLPKEREQLIEIANQNDKNVVYLEFAPGDPSGGPARIIVAFRDEQEWRWKWYADCRLSLPNDQRVASIVPVDPKFKVTFSVDDENRLSPQAGRPFPRAFEQSRRAAKQLLREIAKSDSAEPPQPFVASHSSKILEAAYAHFNPSTS